MLPATSSIRKLSPRFLSYTASDKVASDATSFVAVVRPDGCCPPRHRLAFFSPRLLSYLLSYDVAGNI